MENVVHHIEALNYLWEAHGGQPSPPEGHEKCQKRFPDEENWHWVRITDWGEDRVESPAALSWLNARWTIVERIFQDFTALGPMIRRHGDQQVPRGLEAWEWSCIGLHRLWDGWNHAEGLIRADLRPALFSFDSNEPPKDEPLEYELFYSVERIEALAAKLSGADESEVKSDKSPTGAAQEQEQPPDEWHGVLRGCIARKGLSSSEKPLKLLAALKNEGLARKEGGHVVITVERGAAVEVTIAEFQRVARQTLDEASPG